MSSFVMPKKNVFSYFIFTLVFFGIIGSIDSWSKNLNPGCSSVGCHDSLQKDNNVLHGPFEAGGCTVCHFKNQKDWPVATTHKVEAHRNMIKIDSLENNSACLTCHERIRNVLQNAKLPHKKIEEKKCSFCHNPHSSNMPLLMREDVYTARCFTCHDKMKNNVLNAKVHHPPMSDDRGCTNCHLFHESKEPKLLKNKMPNVCLECHSKEIKTKTDRVIENIGLKFNTYPFVHKPLQAGKCAVCHMPHGSEGNSLLETSIPKGFNIKFDIASFQICFDCHAPELGTDKTSKDTEFRNGLNNLHYTHLQSKTQNMSCLVCHDIHASKQPKQVRDLYNGPDNIAGKIVFTKTNTGGNCTTSCHTENRAYDKEKPIDYSKGTQNK